MRLSIVLSLAAIGVAAVQAQPTPGTLAPNAGQVEDGRYQLRLTGPPWGCVEGRPFATGPAEAPYFGAVNCGLALPEVEVSRVRPNGRPATPQVRYVIRPAGLDRCATVARGVVFGRTRIDSLACQRNMPEDQQFTVFPSRTTPNLFQIQALNGKCWSARKMSVNGFGLSNYPDREIVLQPCIEGDTSQQFLFVKRA
jgi:hypothetical protein